jgi:hypothetical protein
VEGRKGEESGAGESGERTPKGLYIFLFVWCEVEVSLFWGGLVFFLVVCCWFRFRYLDGLEVR